MRQDSSTTDTSANNPNTNITSDPALMNDHSLEDYRQRYGLAVDPFDADPYFPFFTGSQRRELLDQIIHICQFGQGIPVVAGEYGVGKTRLALAIYETLGAAETCVISALPTTSSDLIHREVFQHFGAGFAGSFAELAKQISAANESSLKLILIDNAQDLDDETLTSLVELQHVSIPEHEPTNGGLRIVLFGDPSLVARMQQLESSLPIIELIIERFTLSETVDYLNFRMEIADYLGPEIFTEDKVEPWWREANGQLPLIHRYAQQDLLESVLPPLASGSKPFPILHIVAIALLGGIAFMTFLYSADEEEQEGRVERVPISLQQPAGVPSPMESEGNKVIPTSDTAEPPVAQAPEVSEVSSSAPAQEEAIASSTASVASILTKPEHAVAVEASQIQSSSSVSVVTAPAATPTASVRSSFSSDEETLLSWRESDFTLQLLGVSNEKAAKDYIAQQSNRVDLLMFRTARQGKPWFVVVAGRYSSAAAARNAISALPPEQVKAGPWPRGMKVIQGEIQR